MRIPKRTASFKYDHLLNWLNLQVVYIPDYNVSNAEIIVPASDISQHISTAGTEASGTSNMKFVLNGGLIVGTMDGANIEIAKSIGKDKMFIFGCFADQVEDIRHRQKYRKTLLDPQLESVLDAIRAGRFGDFDTFTPLLDTLTVGGDYYLISSDFASCTYPIIVCLLIMCGIDLKAQQSADQEYKNKDAWSRKSILSAAKMGMFSSDRSIREYAEEIWKIKPCPIP